MGPVAKRRWHTRYSREAVKKSRTEAGEEDVQEFRTKIGEEYAQTKIYRSEARAAGTGLLVSIRMELKFRRFT
jgi:hypothetical protein